MAISFDSALGIHQQALLLREKRSQIIANNIANADTPGFKARDIDFESVLKQHQKRLAQGLDSTASIDRVSLTDEQVLYRRPLQASLDGNTVEPQRENAAFAENALRHQASFQFLNGKFTSMKKALRGE